MDKIAISIPRELLSWLDAYAASKGSSRSRTICDILLERKGRVGLPKPRPRSKISKIEREAIEDIEKSFGIKVYASREEMERAKANIEKHG